DAPGVPAQPGGSVQAGEVVYCGRGTIAADQVVVSEPPFNELAAPGIERNPVWDNPNIRAFIGNAPNVISSGITARSSPYIGPTGASFEGATMADATTPPPTFAFSDKVVPGSAKYIFVKSPNSNSRYWLLTEITMAEGFEDPGVPAVL